MLPELPAEAIARLQREATRTTAQTLGAGNLSVNAGALLGEAGFQMLGPVKGLSVFQIGVQWTSPGWKNSDRQKFGTEGMAYELTIATQAFYKARHLALGRLQQEAALLNATGVAGVTLTHRKLNDGSQAIEFLAIGTAIREKNARIMEHPPYLSTLSGADLWRLTEAGFRPAGLCVGNCTYWMLADSQTRQIMASGALWGRGRQNQELPFYTRCLYEARELAMTRMENEARECGASGIVDAKVEVDAAHSHGMEAMPSATASGSYGPPLIVHFLSIGTAIKPSGVMRDLEIEVAVKANL